MVFRFSHLERPFSPNDAKNRRMYALLIAICGGLIRLLRITLPDEPIMSIDLKLTYNKILAH